MSEKKCIVSAEMRTIIDTIYPVGAYFWSSDDKDPSTFLGGTWEQVKDRFILAAGDTYSAGSTGGEAQHKLTLDEMPTHNHANVNIFYDSGHRNGNGAKIENITDGNYVAYALAPKQMLAGGDKAHNNMPPYTTAYCWHRTA